MAVKTKSLRDPVEERDGTRVLIARYRPRGVRLGAESWEVWDQRLAPSAALLDALRGKQREGRRVVERGGAGLSWEEFTRRFREELAGDDARAALREWRDRARAGGTITVLCHCAAADTCHRRIVQGLLERSPEGHPP